MNINHTKEGSVTILQPVGPAVAAEVEEFDNALMRQQRNWTRRIVLDMSEIPFFDSTGLEILCKHHRWFSEHGLELKLAGLTDMSRNILDLTRISKRFLMFADTSSAVRSFL